MLSPRHRLQFLCRVVECVPQSGPAAAVRKDFVAARRPEQRRLRSFTRADFFHRLVEIAGRTSQAGEQPGFLRHGGHHRPVPLTDHLTEKLRDRFAMAFDVPFLAAADIGDQGDGKGQIRFLPEVADLARLAVVEEAEIFGFKIVRRRACAIVHRAGNRHQIDVHADVGCLLGAERRRADRQQNVPRHALSV